MYKPLHYLILFFIITFAVMSANLLSNYVSLWIAAISLEAATKQQKASIAKNSRIRKQQALHQAQRSKTSREQSSIGKNLERTCIDWVDMARTTPTRTTREGRKKHCDNYHNYIDTGKYTK